MDKSGQKLLKEQNWHQKDAKFGLSMPKKPSNNLLFDHIDALEFFLFFLGSNLELSSHTSRGDN